MKPYVIILAGSTQEGSNYARHADLPRGRWRTATDANAIAGLRRAEVHELPSFAQRRDRHAIESVLRYALCDRVLVDGWPLQVDPDPAIDQGDGMGQQLELASAPSYDVVVHKVRQAEARALTPEQQDAVDWMEKVERPQRAAFAAAIAPTLSRVEAMRELADELEDEKPSFQLSPGQVPEAAVAALGQDVAERINAPSTDDDAVAAPIKKSRRTRCAKCGSLHFSAEPCPSSDGFF